MLLMEPKSRIRTGRFRVSNGRVMRYLSFLLLSLLLLASKSNTVEASKQRDEDDDQEDDTEEPTPSPTPFPSVSPTPEPTATPTTAMPTFGPTSQPTLTFKPATATKSPTVRPTPPPPTERPSPANLYTLQLPNMVLAFALPPGTSLSPTALQKDWQSFLTTVLQVAVGANVYEWTVWDSDVTYTTMSGQGVAQAVGQVALETTRRRHLQAEITQSTLETELYDYFFVWGMDEIWEYFVARGYPITDLNLQFSDNSFSPRRDEPKDLAALMTPEEERNNDKRNAWIAGVVMAIMVAIVATVVAVLYLQRRGRQTGKTTLVASPRTFAASDMPTPQGPERQNESPAGSFGLDLDRLVHDNVIVTKSASEISSVPDFSGSSFCYDASRLDQVIDSARGYEVPYDVPGHTFSDLTTDVKDNTINDDDEEDNIVNVTAGTAHQTNDIEAPPETNTNRALLDKHQSLRATRFQDIPVGSTDPSHKTTDHLCEPKLYNDIPLESMHPPFPQGNVNDGPRYSPSLFDDEKKETGG